VGGREHRGEQPRPLRRSSSLLPLPRAATPWTPDRQRAPMSRVPMSQMATRLLLVSVFAMERSPKVPGPQTDRSDPRPGGRQRGKRPTLRDHLGRRRQALASDRARQVSGTELDQRRRPAPWLLGTRPGKRRRRRVARQGHWKPERRGQALRPTRPVAGRHAPSKATSTQQGSRRRERSLTPRAPPRGPSKQRCSRNHERNWRRRGLGRGCRCSRRLRGRDPRGPRRRPGPDGDRAWRRRRQRPPRPS
jgi:hypothetical protein